MLKCFFPLSTFLFFTCLLTPLSSATQESNTAELKIQEPEYVNQFFALNSDGTLKSLEHATPSQAKNSLVIQGERSSVRFAQKNALSFCIRLASNRVDPFSNVQLYRFAAQGNQRQLKMNKSGNLPLPEAIIPFNAIQYGTASFKITPKQPLAPGEYGLGLATTQDGSFFGIDIAAAANSAGYEPKTGPASSVDASNGAVTPVSGTSTVTEPEYDNTYYVLNDGKLLPLERQTLTNDHQTSRKMFAATIQNYAVAKGAASPVQLSSDTHFVVRFNYGRIDPQTIIRLRRFELRKGDRQLLFESESMAGAGKPFKKTPVEDDIVKVSTKPYGTDSSLEIIPSALLPGDQYCFVAGEKAQCFGVSQQ